MEAGSGAQVGRGLRQEGLGRHQARPLYSPCRHGLTAETLDVSGGKAPEAFRLGHGLDFLLFVARRGVARNRASLRGPDEDGEAQGGNNG